MHWIYIYKYFSTAFLDLNMIMIIINGTIVIQNIM